MELSKSLLSLLSPANVLTALLSFIVLYPTALVIYRLLLSPLAKIPGSKLAAATAWYEVYFDVILGGQFIFRIERWHEQYGPVVRINPWEVHINDPDFHDVAYAQKSRFHKNLAWKQRFGIPHSSFDTIDHDHHALRRSAISPFFAKQKINNLSHFIQSSIDKFCSRLADDYAGKDKLVTLNNAWAALTFDIITEYAFAQSFDFLDYPNFVAPFTSSIRQLALTLHVSGHFPLFLTVLQSLPQSVAAWLNPTIAPVFEFHGELENQIRRIKSGENEKHKDVGHKTVFNELLSSKLPPEELSQERLKHEAASITAAGVDTTKTTMTLGSFFILNSPTIHARLKKELESAMPDVTQPPSLSELEKLPYLSAVIQESLRMSVGISQRLVRCTPHAPLSCGDFTIPPGALFSMSTYLIHHNPGIFPDPHSFRPERWLDEPKIDGKPLSRYLVPFGKGPRMCLGMNLATAELFMALACVFRRLDMRLFETERDAVDMAADFFIPLPKEGTHGVRVLVNGVEGEKSA